MSRAHCTTIIAVVEVECADACERVQDTTWRPHKLRIRFKSSREGKIGLNHICLEINIISGNKIFLKLP